MQLIQKSLNVSLEVTMRGKICTQIVLNLHSICTLFVLCIFSPIAHSFNINHIYQKLAAAALHYVSYLSIRTHIIIFSIGHTSRSKISFHCGQCQG